MPTVDITAAPYNAVADGSYAEATLSIAQGSNVLSSPSALWVPGDAGKFIVVGEAGSAAGGEPQGGTPLRTTISSVAGDGKSVNLAANATRALSALANTVVAWGATNNAAAFAAVATAFAGQTGVIVTVPNSGTGIYLVSSGNGGGLFGSDGTSLENHPGIKGVTVNGTGATIAGGTFQLGGAGQLQTSNHASRVVSVGDGVFTVELVTHAETSRFTVGQYCLLSGFSLQYGGYPSNHQRAEYLLVQSINAGAGTVTFTTPLRNSYLSTWPLFDATGFDYGGPATLYALDTGFDYTAVINGLTIAHHAQMGNPGLGIIFNNCVFKGLYGPYPTMTKTQAYNNCTGVNCTMEVDKYIEDFSMTGCTWSGIGFQSKHPENFTLDSSTVSFSILGTPYKTTIRNGCIIGTLLPGASYGFANELVVSDSTVSAFGDATYHIASGIANMTGAINANEGFNNDAGVSMSGGVITMPNSYKTSGWIEQWMTTGAKIFWYDPNVGTIGSFTITDVTQDATNTYVQTTWPGGFPSRSYGALGLWMHRHSAPVCTFRNVTGCQEVVDLSGAPAGAPLYSYTNRPYTSSVAARYWQMYGKIKKIIVNVGQAYTEGGAVTAQLNNTCVKVGDKSDFSFVPVINLKIPGTRTLDVSGGYPAAWTGGQAGDTLPTLNEPIWSCSNYNMLMTAGVSSGAFSVEFQTDQGFDVDLSTTKHVRRPPRMISHSVGNSWQPVH